jgi:pSer/pThr/pTyr-binding forkhead associated (FHA) protein
MLLKPAGSDVDKHAALLELSIDRRPIRKRRWTTMIDSEVTVGPGKLLIRNGEFEGMDYALRQEETIIGRNPTTDITLLDEGISREHALILWDPDAAEFTIEDLQSTNGTKVNGKRVRSAALCEGDEIEIGRTRFEFIRSLDSATAGR